MHGLTGLEKREGDVGVDWQPTNDDDDDDDDPVTMDNDGMKRRSQTRTAVSPTPHQTNWFSTRSIQLTELIPLSNCSRCMGRASDVRKSQMNISESLPPLMSVLRSLSSK